MNYKKDKDSMMISTVPLSATSGHIDRNEFSAILVLILLRS